MRSKHSISPYFSKINDSNSICHSTRHSNNLNSKILFNKTFTIYKNKNQKLFPSSPGLNERDFSYPLKKLLKKQKKVTFGINNYSQKNNSTSKLNKIRVNPSQIQEKDSKNINKSSSKTIVTIKKINYVQFINKKLNSSKTTKNIRKIIEKNTKKEKKHNSIILNNSTINANNNASNLNIINNNNYINTISNINSTSNKSSTTRANSNSSYYNLLSKNNNNFNKFKIYNSKENDNIKYFNISNNYNELTLNYNFCSKTMENFVNKGLMLKYEEAQNKFRKNYFAAYIQKIFRGFYFRRYEFPFINSSRDYSTINIKNSNVYFKKKWGHNSFCVHQNYKKNQKYGDNILSSKTVINRKIIPKIKEIAITGIGLKKKNLYDIEIFRRPKKQNSNFNKKKKFIYLVNNMIKLKNCIDFWRNFVWMKIIRKNLINYKKINEVRLRSTIKNIVINFDNRKKNNFNYNNNNNLIFNTNNEFSFKK